MLTDVYRTAVVTGASGGIGAAVVRRLTAAGIETIAASIEPEKLEALGAETGATPLALDVGDHAAVEAALGGRTVDILVNAAGVLGGAAKLFETTPADAEAVVRVNVLGIQNCLRAAVPGMVARNRGHVVNFGSAAGRYAITGEPLYGGTKAAVHLMSLNLRLDLFGSDVRVTEILPGRVESGMHAEMVGGDRAKAQALYYDPYQCLQPSDVADVVLYALSAPAHVDLTQIEMMPTRQVMGGADFLRSS